MEPLVVGHLGVERRRHCVCPVVTATILSVPSSPATVARTSTGRPTRSTHGARMNTAVHRAGPAAPAPRRPPRRSRPGAEGVAAHGHVDGAQAHLVRPAVEDLGGQQDHPGAGPHDRQTRGEAPAGVLHPVADDEHADGRRLAPGNDQAGHALQVGSAAPSPRRHRSPPASADARGSPPAARERRSGRLTSRVQRGGAAPGSPRR
jgi:hypothetical protein